MVFVQTIIHLVVLSEIFLKLFLIDHIVYDASSKIIIMDFILKDIAFLEQKDRESKLSIGLKYGNLGKEGIDKIISMAMHISGVTSANTIMKSLDSIPVDILKDFFSKNENAKKAFGWAKELSILAFSSTLIYPNEIESSLKGVLSVILDFLSIDRKTFFETK